MARLSKFESAQNTMFTRTITIASVDHYTAWSAMEVTETPYTTLPFGHKRKYHGPGTLLLLLLCT